MVCIEGAARRRYTEKKRKLSLWHRRGASLSFHLPPRKRGGRGVGGEKVTDPLCIRMFVFLLGKLHAWQAQKRGR